MGGAYEGKVPGSNLARKNLSFSSNGSHSMETFNTDGTGKPDPKTIYGIETGPKDHIWD